MPITVSGWVIWNSNANPFGTPDFVPKEIYPPALEVAELTETVYGTQAQAQAAIDAHGGAHNYHAASAAGGIGSGVVGPAAGGVQSALSSTSAVTGFLSQLGSANLWIRVAEVVIGIALMAIGVAQLTKAIPIATKIAKAVK